MNLLDAPPGSSKLRHRLRLILGSEDGEATIIEVRSAADLNKYLGDRACCSQIYIWREGRWWCLNHDLPGFCTYLIERGYATPQEARRFFHAPTHRTDWLYDAIEQQDRLLEAALTNWHYGHTAC